MSRQLLISLEEATLRQQSRIGMIMSSEHSKKKVEDKTICKLPMKIWLVTQLPCLLVVPSTKRLLTSHYPRSRLASQVRQEAKVQPV